MKSFVLWLVIAVVTAGAGAGAYHGFLSAYPRLVVVVVDSAFEMRARLPAARRAAEALVGRYSQYALYTEKARIHGWTDRLRPGSINAYGPRNLERVAEGLGPEFDEADEVHFISNASASDLAGLPGHWTVHRLR